MQAFLQYIRICKKSTNTEYFKICNQIYVFTNTERIRLPQVRLLRCLLFMNIPNKANLCMFISCDFLAPINPFLIPKSNNIRFNHGFEVVNVCCGAMSILIPDSKRIVSISTEGRNKS